MQVIKHFAETVGLGIIGKLDKEDELPTPDSLRGLMRRFYNTRERHYNLKIPLNVKRLMAPVSKVILLLKDNLACYCKLRY